MNPHAADTGGRAAAWRARRGGAALAAAVLGGAGLASAAVTAAAPSGPRPAAAASALGAPQLHVSGNRLVNARGARVILHGVDRSGTEYACVQGWGIFDGPSNQASITAMKRWHVNAVRVPLNEACWNGEPYVNPSFAGATYRAAIKAYVRLLNSSGMDVILDLHWTDGRFGGCSSWHAVCQKPMPDMHAVRFWKSVAHAFKGNGAVIFDLFNEPFPAQVPGSSETQGWRCWRNGGSACTGISYRVAGMQTLVGAVRSTGARNVIMLGGLSWSNDLTQWLAHKPTDPDHNLVASWHSYNFNACSTRSCWDSQIAPVLKRVPVIAGEIGENDCAAGYIKPLMSWLDARSASYLAWTWDDWSGACASGPALITAYNGNPTAYGAGYRAHLRSLAGGPRVGTGGAAGP